MSVNAPNYPGSVWDGTSPTRPSRTIERSAEAEDYDQIAAEVISAQTEVDNVKSGVSPITNLNHDGPNAGFFGATPVVQPTVNGSAGANAALISLLDELATLGLIIDNSS